MATGRKLHALFYVYSVSVDRSAVGGAGGDERQARNVSITIV